LSNADWGSLSTPSLNNFENFETGINGKEISWNPEVAGLLKSEQFNRNSRNWKGESCETEFPDTKFSKISVYLPRLFSFPRIPENAVPFLLEIYGN